MRFEAAIFDLDGTLLDSTGVWRRIDEVCLGKRGIEVPSDYIDALSTMNLGQCAEYTIRLFDFDCTPEELIREWDDMARHEYAENIPLKPGAAELLRYFAENGVKLALATASDPEYFIPALERTGVYGLFNTCVHSRPGLLKGNAGFFIHCAEKLSVSPEKCVVFEDVLDGIKAAKAAGMYAVAVKDVADASRQREIDAAADMTVGDLREFVEKCPK